MTRRIRNSLLATLATLAVTSGIAPAANATAYHAGRPGVFVDAETQGHRISLGFEVKLHCVNGGSSFVGTGIGPIAINQQTGRFHGERETSSGETYSLTRVHGTVHSKVVTGRIFERFVFRKQCQTGSEDDPWVRFIARRTTTYTASRPGFSIELQTLRGDVVRIESRYTVHCSDDSATHQSLGLTSPAISNGPSGTFKWEASGGNLVRKIRGTVHENVITGHLLHRYSLTPDRKRHDCWSGQSLNDPRVDFVARRQ